jgi:tetratricopeptide (TPR) repeat protein
MSDFQTAITLGKVEYIDRLAKFVTWKPIDRTVSTKTQWRYTLQKPGADWQQPEYNDSAWKTGGPRFEAGIKNPDWPEQQIWLRTEFTLDSPPTGSPVFLVYADDEVTISLNGQPAGQANWIDTRFQAISSQVPFRQGRNVIAVHCRNVELRAGVHVIPGVKAQGEKLLAVLSAMLRSHPENESLLQQRAELYSDFEQWDKAAEDYVSFLKLRSQSPDWGSGSNWGTDRSNFLQNLAGNEELFEALRRQLPGDSDLWLARGRSLALRSEWDAAAEAFSQYSETPAADSEVWFEIACINLIDDDVPGYQKWLARLTEQAGENPKAFSAFVLARTCGLAEQKDDDLAQKAVAWGEFAVSQEPKDWFIHGLGLSHLRAGNLVQAEKLFHQSMDRNGWGKPQNELGLALVAQAQRNQDQAEKYISSVRRWIDEQQEEAQAGPVDVQSIDWIAVHALLREAEAKIPGE